jgi:hypothetical protein
VPIGHGHPPSPGHSVYEKSARSADCIIGGAHGGKLTFQPLKERGGYRTIQHHNIGGDSQPALKAVNGDGLVRIVDRFHAGPVLFAVLDAG